MADDIKKHLQSMKDMMSKMDSMDLDMMESMARHEKDRRMKKDHMTETAGKMYNTMDH